MGFTMDSRFEGDDCRSGSANGAHVATHSRLASDPNCPTSYKLTASASFAGSIDAYSTIRNTYPSGDIKGRGSREGFYFIFGKWGR
jgi:hypothetical protein